MEPILSLSPQQFRAALAELQLDPAREAMLVEQYNAANAPQPGGRDRGMLRNLLDNIIGFDDEVVTPGERLGAGVQQFAGGLLSDPLGMAGDIAQGGYETIERAMAPGATPMDVMGAAGMAMLGGGMVTGPRGALRSGLLRDAADETPAQQVARLLREGRADEVTDDLMAQADPQEMYRLYVAGETGMDLPMDEASRMVRAAGQGYDISRPMYHGTDTDFTSVDTNMGSGERYRTGFFTSDNPNVAASYAPNRDRGMVLPVFSRASDQGVVVDAQGSNWNRIDAASPARYRNSLLANEFPELVGDENAYSYFSGMYDDLMGLPELSTNAMARERRFEGDPSITFENVIDRGPYSLTDIQAMSASQPSRVAVDFYPQNIRARFARFDPRLSHLANLNAANVDPITGAAAVTASQQDDPLANLRAYISASGGILPR